MTAGQCIGGCVLGVSSRGCGLCPPGFCDIIKPQVWSGGGGGKYATPSTPTLLTLPQLRIPWLLFFFFPPPLPHDGRASCGAGSQLCFLSQSPFMWSLPRVLPVDSQSRSRVFPPRRAQAGRQAGPAAVIAGLARQPSPTLRRLLAFTTHCAVAGLKVRISHAAVFISRMPRPSKIVPLSKLSQPFFFLLRVFAERNKRLSFFQTRQCYCHSFIQNKIGPQSAAGDQSSVQ